MGKDQQLPDRQLTETTGQ